MFKAPHQITALWLQSQLHSNSVPNNVSVTFKLNKPLQLLHLQNAVNQLIAQFESLRSRFTFQENSLFIEISDSHQVTIHVDSLADLRKRQISLESYIYQNQFFPLATQSDVRYRFNLLMNESNQPAYFQMTFDHLVADGESQDILIHTFIQNLKQQQSGEQGTAARTQTPSFVQYLMECQSEFTQKKIQASTQYWRNDIEDTPAFSFRVKPPESAKNMNKATLKRVVFSPKTSQTIHQRLAELQVKPFSFFVAGLGLLLNRWTGQSDGTIGILFSQRTKIDLQYLVGHLVNALPLRLNLSAESGITHFRQFVQAVHHKIIKSLRHSEASQQQLLTDLRIRENSLESSLFNIVANWYEIHASSDMQELGIQHLEVTDLPAPFGCNFIFISREGHFEILFKYNAALFSEAFIDRVLDSYVALIENVIVNVDRPIKEISIASAKETDFILQNFVTRDPKQHICYQTSVVQQIEEQARLRPQALALELMNFSISSKKIESVTFEHFNQRANRIAHSLIESGIKRGEFVALYLERDLAIPTAALGIMKAGGAYIALDPEYPENRIVAILKDSGCRKIFVQARTSERLQKALQQLSDEIRSQIVVIKVDQPQIFETFPEHNLNLTLKENDTAYCIYTSGSTGAPKGVVVEHGSLSCHCAVSIREYQLSPADRVLQFAAVTFDASVEQTYATLCAGATLVMRGSDIWNPFRLKRNLLACQVSVAHFPTPFWNSLGADVAQLVKDLPLRILRFGGEAMLVPPVSFQLSPSLRLLNSYGPTETTVTACYLSVPNLSEADLRTGKGMSYYSIGRPLPGVEMFILDEVGNFVPRGVIGEIYIGGYGVTRGYLNRSELTAEKFVPHYSDPTRRMYKTGDLARWREDGCVEFLGRNDDQVKIRGYRIEIGEIESALKKISGVQEAVVIALTLANGEKALAAYTVGAVVDLKAKISQLLPKYMVPTYFVTLDVLPLSVNGKVNRKKLPLPESFSETPQNSSAQPTEHQVLGVKPLSEEQKLKILKFSKSDVQESLQNNNPIHNRIEKYALENPSKIALEFNQQGEVRETLTYGELNEQSDHIAEYILQSRRQGQIGSEPFILICFERSLEMIVTMLGILKSGYAYLPLDPKIPHERKTFIIKDSEARLVFGHQKTTALFANEKILFVNVNKIRSEQSKIQETKPQVKLNDLAYCIYTSGSTGTPKGVLIEHNSLIRYVDGLETVYQFNSQDRILQFAAITFDVSVEQIFGGLNVGATIIVKDDDVWSPENIPDLLHKSRITVAHLPAPYWNYWAVRAQEFVQKLKLRVLLFGGESMLQPSGPIQIPKSTEIINTYGPTEATVDATYFNVKSNQALSAHYSIGRPLPGVEIFILDEELKLVDVGVIGEIYIGGSGVARGYLNRPELSAEKFVTHILDSNRKLYKTGDLARWSDAGLIEFLGRNDDQVKIRGFRIELGEIESALHQISGVKEAVVLAFTQPDGNKALCGFVVGRTDGLSTQLEKVLSDYMIPNQFVGIEKIPYTLNGKVDRKSLLSLLPQAAAIPAQNLAQTDLEKGISELWSIVLKIKNIDVTKNFFMSGGHSLSAMSLLSLIYNRYQIEISLRELYQHSTVKLLAELISNRNATVHDAPVRHNLDRGPASSAQARIWYIDQLDRNENTYFISYLFEVAKNTEDFLDPVRLKMAFKNLQNNHASLRTSFYFEHGTVQQCIHTELPVHFKIQHFKDKTELMQLVAEENRISIDLQKAPLWRACLFQNTSGEQYLFVIIHHIIFDAASIGVFFRDLHKFYKVEEVSQSALNMIDCALWERSDGREKNKSEGLKYFISELSGVQTHLTTKQMNRRPQDSVPKPSGHIHFSLTQPAQKEKYSNFIVLTATTACALHRYTGQSEICIGYPVSLRSCSELECLMGFMVNTLAIKVQFQKKSSFDEIVEQVAEKILNNDQYKDVPYDQIVRALSDGNSFSGLFDIMVAYENASSEGELKIGASTLKSVPIESNTKSKFPIVLTFIHEKNKNDLAGVMQFDQDYFTSDQIKTLTEYIQNIRRYVAAQPQVSLQAIPLLTEAQQQKILNFSRTDLIHTNKTLQFVHEKFEQYALVHPNQIALELSHHGTSVKKMTYAELNQQADRVAAQIQLLQQQNKNQAQEIIAICFERSLEMIVAIMGILKSGSAYLPIDSKAPEDRVAYILKDSKAGIVLGHSQTQEKFAPHQIHFLDVNTIRMQSENQQYLKAYLQWTDLAYCLYTSGSTGIPKGVMIEHRSLSQYVSSLEDLYEMSPQDRVMQFAAITFDASVDQIFSALSVGATLVVRDEAIWPAESFPDYLKRLKISIALLPSMYWNSWIENAQKLIQQLDLRILIFGGEAVLQPPQPIQLSQKTKIINAYGPTEATVIASTYVVQDQNPSGAYYSIGRPFPGVEIFILDEHHNLVNTGVVGEMYIAGPNLARGYLNQPTLTTEKFVPHWRDNTQRMYKTGDQARWLENGLIEFLGRNDDQVKIRGLRIELGEIETALRKLPGVTEAVVLALSQADGSKSLCAFVVGPVKDAGVQLQRSLIDYMIPAQFIALDHLPLNASGKIDRRKLILLAEQSALAEAESIQFAQTDLEKDLSEIWSQLLKKKNIDVHKSFFAMGGHSMSAMSLLALIYNRFKVEVTLRELYKNPTIALLAQMIAQAITKGQSSGALQDSPQSYARTEGPATYAQARLWYIDQLQPGANNYLIPYLFEVEKKFNTEQIKMTLQQLQVNHPSLRTSFFNKDGEVRQHIHLDREIDFAFCKVADQQELFKLVDNESRKAINLESSPIWRIRLYEDKNGKQHLYFLIHHIVFDATSMAIFLKDFKQIYEGLQSPHQSTSNQLNMIDYALWERSLSREALKEKGQQYFISELNGVETSLNLPQYGHHQKSETGTVAFNLDRQNSTESDFAMVIALAASVLHRQTGKNEICLAYPVSLRTRRELEQLVGFMVNTLVIKVVFQKQSTFQDILQQVAEKVLNNDQYKEVPYDKIIQNLPRKNQHDSVFEVLLTYENAEPKSTDASEENFLKWIPFDSDTQSKFPLILAFSSAKTGVQSAIHFDKKYYKDTQAQLLAENIKMLNQTVLIKTDILVDKIPLLSSEQKEKILGYSRSPLKRSGQKLNLVHENFTHFARAHKGKIALELYAHGHVTQTMTFDELNEKSDFIADQIIRIHRSKGVPKNALVGICFERSLEMIVAMLGILKSGNAYLPIDPLTPDDRVSFILNDSEAQLVLGHDRTHEKFKNQQVEFLNIKNTPGVGASSPSEVRPVVQVSDLAYCIYTSGSTGTPKGVLVEHGSLSQYAYNLIDVYQYNENDRVLQFASITFDVSVDQIFGSLNCGATLVVRSEEIWSPEETVQILKREKISVAFLPTLYWNYWGEKTQTFVDQLSSRLVLFAGEALLQPPTSVRMPTATQIVNAYGPTETTVVVTAYTLQNQNPSGAYYSIGRPMPGVDIFILDEHHELVNIGVVGEIYIAGPGVARGYLKRPELSAEKFVSHIFDQGRKMYKTGDQGRWLENGLIEFLGRSDDQVKIRGFRVELGEVESALRKLPGVKEAVVLALQQADGNKALCAFIVGRIEGLAKDLSHAVIDYMVPSQFIALEQLPFNSSGKVDRKKLIALVNDIKVQEVLVAPENESEKNVLEIWKMVLKRDDIGVESDFFKMGGHSLLAMKLLAHINQNFKKPFSLKNLIENPTVRRLLNCAKQLESDTLMMSIPFSTTYSETQQKVRYVLFPGAAMSVTAYQSLADGLAKLHPTSVLMVAGIDTHSAPHEKLEEIVEAYLEALQSCNDCEQWILVGHSFGGYIAAEVAERLEKQGQKVKLILVESLWPFRRTDLQRAFLNDVAISSIKDFDGVDLSQVDRIYMRQSQMQKEYIYSGYIPRDIHVLIANKSLINEYYDNGQITFGMKTDKQNIVIEKIDGDHFSILQPRHVINLISKISSMTTQNRQ